MGYSYTYTYTIGPFDVFVKYIFATFAHDYGAGYSAPHATVAALDNHSPGPLPAFTFADLVATPEFSLTAQHFSFAPYRAVLTTGRLIDVRAEIRQRTLSRLA